MKKIIFALLLLFTSNSVLFSQKFQIIENEYITENYLTNGMIFIKTKLITQKHRIIKADYNDPYAPWHHVKLISSSVPIIYSEGKIQVNPNEINRENHKLILTFSDTRNLCQTTDTIDLPFITNIYLNSKKFIVNEENIISYDIKLNNGKVISNSYSLLDKKDLCPCNKNDFKLEYEKLIPIFNSKKNTLNTTLCLMRKSSGEIVFNEDVELTFKSKAHLDFSGKNGLNGKSGVSASSPSESGRSGENGSDGQNAPNVSVFISQLKINNDSILKIEGFGTNGTYLIDFAHVNSVISIYAKGGDGGDGGNGGNGADGLHDNETNQYRNAKGGNGGNGGSGGNAGNGGAIAVYYKNDFLINHDKINMINDGGKSGKKGNAGYGGSADSETLVGLIFSKSDNGSKGSNGSSGGNGISNNFTKIQHLSPEEFDKLYQEKLKKMFD